MVRVDCLHIYLKDTDVLNCVVIIKNAKVIVIREIVKH